MPIARYIDIRVPVTTCNLRCTYCYVAATGRFSAVTPQFPYSPVQVRRALSRQRLGGTCFINLCADGETLLAPKILDYVYALLSEGHYLSIVTNGTLSSRFAAIAAFPADFRERLFFKFSYHYEQLIERGLLDAYFDNICLMRQAGCSFTVEITPYDGLLQHIDAAVEACRTRLGAAPHFTIARDELSPDLRILTSMTPDEYYATWGRYGSEMLSFKRRIFGIKRREFCYAGEWSFYLDLLTGEMSQCYHTKRRTRIFDDPDLPIPFSPVGWRCPDPHCYNGHSWLTWGDIPGLAAPTYAEIRNRRCADGTEWLTLRMKSFMSQRLYEAHRSWPLLRKLAALACTLASRQSANRT